MFYFLDKDAISIFETTGAVIEYYSSHCALILSSWEFKRKVQVLELNLKSGSKKNLDLQKHIIHKWQIDVLFVQNSITKCH